MAPQDDKSQGKFQEYAGKAKKAWGDMTDDEKAEAQGKAKEAKGKGQEKFGEAKDWVEEKTGDDEENQDRA